jgi:hypothetical protein
MITRAIVLSVSSGLLVSSCSAPRSETEEIIENLIAAGFPAGDIAVVDGVVHVGRDARVSLAASRELLDGGTSKEQYRTSNLVSPSLKKICIDGSTFTGAFSTALDLAIQNYDEQSLTFSMVRTPSPGCGFTITALIEPDLIGGFAGFPAGGLPFSTIHIGDGLASFGVDTIEHVITHEIGHTLGFRHSDFFDRSISCGGAPEDEGDAGIGAIHIPGTPTGAVVGGSLMNSCFRDVETGEFTASDVTALDNLYLQPAPPLVGDFDNDSDHDIAFAWYQGPGAGLGLQIRTKLSNADGTYAARSQNLGDGNGIWNKGLPLVGDFNADGRDDVAFAWFEGPGLGLAIRTKLSNGDGTYTSLSHRLGDGDAIWNKGQPLVGDFNGDNRDDIAFAWFEGAGLGLNIRTKFSNGDGTYTARSQRLGDGDAIWNKGAPLVGDFDGDGDDDIAFAWYQGAGASLGLQIRTKLSNGDGTYAARSQTLGDGDGIWNAGAPLVGDFDGDDDADIAFAWYQGAGAGLGLQIRTKLSNGDGTYAARSQSLGDGDGIWNRGAPLVGDFDNDGDADIAFAWYQGAGAGLGLQVRTKLSNGDGTYAARSQSLGDGDGIWNKGAPLVGDFNHDGRADIAFAWYQGAGAGLGLQIRTKLSNGDGTYSGFLHSLGDGDAIWNGSQQ